MKRYIKTILKPSVVTLLGITLVGLATSASAQSNSPWLPIPGSGSISLNFVDQSGDSAYIGDRDIAVSAITGGAATEYKRTSYGLKLGYGISDSLAIDASIGRAKVKVGAADNDSGAIDSVIGINWRVVDEYEIRSAPTVTLRGAAIINGSYNGAKLAALGKDADGYELSVLLGRQFTSAIRAWGGIGIEKRGNDVPQATFFDLNAGYSLTPALSFSVGYTNKKYAGNLNIGGPGFSPAAFQRVNEVRETVRLGASYAVAGNQTVALSLGKILDGKNTVKDDRILGLSYTYAF